jgi:transcription elongation factor/antiterminator RfaH
MVMLTVDAADAILDRLDGNKRWYLVRTLPKCERKAECHLGAQGFATYLPRVWKTARHARQFKTVRAPVFPSYLFVELDLERDRWLSVRSTIGVSRLITNPDGRPVPAPVGIVESLIGYYEGDLTLSDASLVKGQRVRILSGPLADLRGTLDRLNGAGRVQVLLDIMGTSVPVTLHRSALSPAA